MSTLIVMVLAGLGFAYFASQNTGFVDITLANSSYTIPIYLMALGSLLIGLLISGAIYLVDNLNSMFEIHNRESTIKQKQHTVESLSARIHDLELENARLKGQTDYIEPTIPAATKAKSLFQKLRYHIPA